MNDFHDENRGMKSMEWNRWNDRERVEIIIEIFGSIMISLPYSGIHEFVKFIFPNRVSLGNFLDSTN